MTRARRGRVRSHGLSREDPTRLGFLEMPLERGIEAVAQAQEFDGVEGPLGDPLLHLHPAGAALGGADLDVIDAEAVQEAAAGAERGAEVLAGEAVRAGHPRAAPV